MKNTIRFAILILTICAVVSQVIALEDCKDKAIEVIEVKEIGLSDSDETKSVIEVKWCVNQELQPNASNFNVTLEVTYADGAILIFDQQVLSPARSSQLEVPALHKFRGKKSAIIKQIKAFITTV